MNQDDADVFYETSDSRYFGKYRGTVVDNNDPHHQGRVKVTCNVTGADQIWAMPCVPYAGKDRGMLFLPEIGTQVWVEFEGGDMSYPIWAGCFWGENDVAPADHAPHIKLIKTEKIEIRIDDQANTITISNSFGTILEIKDGKMVGKANTEIIHQVAGTKTALNVLKFDVHDGALSVSS